MLGSPPTTASSASANGPLLRRSLLGGVLASLLAALPVSFLKTFIFLSTLCKPASPEAFKQVVSLWSCGVLYNTWRGGTSSFLAYTAFVILGGALSGALLANAATRRRHPRSTGGTPRFSHVFWWGTLGGVLFDVFFVFIFLYPGQ